MAGPDRQGRVENEIGVNLADLCGLLGLIEKFQSRPVPAMAVHMGRGGRGHHYGWGRGRHRGWR
jgi:hypothetical protein